MLVEYFLFPMPKNLFNTCPQPLSKGSIVSRTPCAIAQIEDLQRGSRGFVTSESVQRGGKPWALQNPH